MKRTHYTEEIFIPAKELEHYENLLASEGVDFDAEGIPEYSTITMWTVHFPDGCFADIKVNSNSRADGDFFSEAVLFSKDGSQLDFSDCQYDLKGTWNLSSNDTDYTINVKEN